MIPSFEPDRRARTLCAVAVLALAGVGMAARPAHAQPAPPPVADPKEMARRLGEEALALHAEGKFADAYSRFETAEKILHSPVFVLWMARSKRALAELVAAKRLYESVVAERLDEGAPPKWSAAQADAKKELAALSAKVPAIEPRFPAHAPPGLTAEIDGRPAKVGQPVELDPGEHLVRALRGGAPVAERRVRLEEGQGVAVVELAFPLATSSAPPSAQRAPLTSRATKGSIVPGAVLLGAGAATIVAGAVTGGFALGLAGDVKNNCQGDACRPEDAGKADDAKTLSVASTVCFIAGGALAASGVVLLVVRPGGRAAPPASIGVGPASMTLRFAF
jgi:hypothetical protein